MAGVHDPHYKATLSVALHGARLQFHVAQDLFSSASLDPGTALLLRTLAGTEYRRVLDLGCGYGPLGLFLKAWRSDCTAHLVDRDELAVRFAGLNAQSNKLDGIDTYPSLGYDEVPARDFDLIVSNIPAKAGPRPIESFLLDGVHFLGPRGWMAVVVIDRLAGSVRDLLRRASADVHLERSNRGYTCFHYAFTEPPATAYAPAFERGVYDRGSLRHGRTQITTVYGLPEFDTPGFATQLALKLLPRLGPRPIVALNPGQGLVPAAATVPVSAADRDLLAIRNTARNARLAEVEPAAVVALLRDREATAVTLADLARYPTADRILAAGTSTQITRLLEATSAQVVERIKNRGFSAAVVAVPTDKTGVVAVPTRGK